MTMRTPELEKKYQAAKKAGKLIKIFNEELVMDFNNWRIVKNRFPHNQIATVNDMIVLKRECTGLGMLKGYEWAELGDIIWQIRNDYDTFTFNLSSVSSITNIPHAHLYKLREEFK